MIRSPIIVGVLLYIGSSVVGIWFGGPLAPYFMFREGFPWGQPSSHFVLLLLAIQVLSVALIVYGIIRRVRRKPSLATMSARHSAWSHLVVGIFLAVTAAVWIGQYDVWTSTKLDLFGLTAHGKSSLIPNREIAEYTCKFTTATGEVIRGRVGNWAPKRGLGPEVFVYLPDNPDLYKIKGSGRGAQITVLVFLILSLWQIITGLVCLRKKEVSHRSDRFVCKEDNEDEK